MSNLTPPTADPGGYFAGWPAPAGPASSSAPTVNQFGTPILTAPPLAPPTSYGAALPPAAAGTSNRNRVIAVVAALVVLLAGVAWFVWPKHHTLSTPATAAGYQLLSGAQFDGVRASMQSQLPGDDLKSTVVAVYGSGTTPYAVIVAARPGKHANTAYQALVAGFEGDASAPVSSVAAGHLGGQMMCGAVTERGETAPTCAWGDKDTVGVILMVGGSTATAPTQAVEFRNAIEH